MSGYTNLKIYILAHELDNDIFTLAKVFPNSELYALTDQILRSTHSITSNIAEGFGRRFYQQEYIRFLSFSRGSYLESREHLKAAYHRGYVLEKEFLELDDKFDHLGRMLTLLINKIRITQQATN